MSYNKDIAFPIVPTGFTVSSVTPPPVSHAEKEKLIAASFDEGKEKTTQHFMKEVSLLRETYASRQEEILKAIQMKIDSVLQELDTRLPSLVVGVAERVLGGIKLDAEMVEKTVTNMLSEFGKEDEHLEVFLNPEDLNLLKSLSDKDTPPTEESNDEGFASAIAGIFDGIDGDDALLEGYPNVKFHEDNSLNRGDCQIKSRYGLLDGRITTKLKRLEEEIRGD